DETLRSAIYVIIFLFVGAGLEWLYWRYAGGTLRRIELGSLTTLGQSVSGALIRGVLLSASILIFALGALGTFLSFDWPSFAGELVLSLLMAVVTMRVVSTLAVFVLAPRVDGLRLLPLDGPAAKLLFNWTMAVVAIGVIGFFAAETLDELAIAPAAVLAVKAVAGMIFVLILITAVWSLEAVFSGRHRATEDEDAPALIQSRQGPRHLGSIIWSALILTAFGFWLMGLEEVMWTVVILALLVPAIITTRVLVNHMFDRAETDAAPAAETEPEAEPTDEVAGEEAPEATAEIEGGRHDLYRLIIDRLARFTLVILAVIGIGAVWGVGILSLSTSPTLAGRAFGIAVDITVALLIADLVWVWAKTAIDRRMANFTAPEPGHTPGPEARMATLLPLLRKILMVTVIIMVVLIGLSSLGINIGPLLAGAGVMGIAIGFGAQALVRDIVSGIFFLIDDAFRVGEYIEMGELRGTVESISIRSLRVRHHRGAVHTIPFGELKSLTNYSRDWVVMKLEFRVGFDADLMLVKKIVKQIGKELQQNPDYGHHILEPLKSQGVRRMEEFNMVIGVKFMAKPGEQWTIRRDAYQRIRDAFDAHGISFAQRNVKVEVVGDQPMTEDVKKAAVSAAQEAVEQQADAAGQIPSGAT
ncbi:MAG: mechanosensitive ion channel family protein, partial [Geminicoccaceae bacterium]